MGKDNTILSSLFDDTRRMVSAFEGFTGPLDKVQAGDFQAALRLLREVCDTAFRNAELGHTKITIGMNEADKLLARLSPTEDSSHG